MRLHGIEEVPHLEQRIEHRPVAAEAVEDNPPGTETLDVSLEVGEVAIDLHLLRRLVQDLDHAAVDLSCEVDINRGPVANHLPRRLIERHHQAAFTAARTLGQELQPHDSLADARDARDQRRAANEVSTVQERVEPVDSGGDTAGEVSGASLCPPRRVHGLRSAVDLQTAPVDDAEGVHAHHVLLAARFHDLEGPDHGAPHGFPAQADDRVRDEVFGRRPHAGSVRGRLESEDGGHALAVKPLDEHVEQLAPLAVAVASHARQAVDEDASGIHPGRLGQQKAIGLLNLFLEDVPRGGDDLQSALRFQLSEVPAEQRRVTHQLLRGHLERGDDSRLAEFPRAPIDEFQAERGLSRARCPRDDDHVASWYPPVEDTVESFDPRPDELGSRHKPALSFRGRRLHFTTARGRRREAPSGPCLRPCLLHFDATAVTYPPIRDYAVIGDGRTAALIARNGSIDWLCLPDLDSPSVFAAVLDAERGGRFSLGPAVTHEIRRRYLPGTNVLETTFTTAEGVARVVDAMNLPDAALCPARELARRVEGVAGRVPMRWRVEPRFDYARGTTRVEPRRPFPIATARGHAVAVCAWDAGTPECGDDAITGRFEVREGGRALRRSGSCRSRDIATPVPCGSAMALPGSSSSTPSATSSTPRASTSSAVTSSTMTRVASWPSSPIT